MENYPGQEPEQNMAEEEGSGYKMAGAVGKAVGIAAAVGAAAYGLASLFASRLEEPAQTSRKAAKALEPHGNLSAPKKERWQPPECSWYKLNTDGTSQELQDCSGAGGLIRDYTGKYFVGFSVKLKFCNSDVAEWWGAYHGLSLAWERGFKRIILEIDNEGVANKINEIIKRNDFNLNAQRADTPKEKIRRLLGNDWEVEVIHLRSKVNKCADRLAEMAVKKNDMGQLSVMEQPPDDPHFQNFLSEDSNGVSAT